MVDSAGVPTTGLLRGVRYIKDNRLLPAGMRKAGAEEAIAVRGGAVDDADFDDGGDRVIYRVPVGDAPGPFRVEAQMLFQSIGFRWARNLKPYEAPETRRFVSYYEATSGSSAVTVASALATH